MGLAQYYIIIVAKAEKRNVKKKIYLKYVSTAYYKIRKLVTNSKSEMMTGKKFPYNEKTLLLHESASLAYF